MTRARPRGRSGVPGQRIGSVALIGRAPDSKSGGCRFESCLTRSQTRRHTQMALQEQISKVRDVVPRSVTFLQEVWAELKKVHWPSRKETYAATVVVLVVVGIVALFLGVVDFAISQIVQAILR